MAARPQFEDLSAEETRQLVQAPPRQPDPVAPPLETDPELGRAAVSAPLVKDEGNPANVQRAPADSAPRESPSLESIAGLDSRITPGVAELEAGFEQAERVAAADALKTPEQREAEAKEAEEAAAAKTAEEEAAKTGEPAKVEDKPLTTAETESTIAAVEESLKDPHIKKRDEKRYRQLLGSLKAEKTARSEYEAKVKELEAKTATVADTAELTKLRDALSKTEQENLQYRWLQEAGSAPEIVEKFDKPVQQAEATIEAILPKYQLGGTTLELIKKEGGFASFSKSAKTFSVTEQQEDPDNPGQTKAVKVNRTAAQIARGWLNAMDPSDSAEINAMMGEQAKQRVLKQAYIDDGKGKAKEYFEQRKTQASAQTVEQQEAAKKTASEYAAWVEEKGTKTDWLKPQDLPAAATPEQKTAIEEHNKFVNETREFIKNPVKNLEDYKAAVADAAEARHLRRELPKREARIKELEAQVARLQKGSVTTPRSGSLLPGAAKPTEQKAKKLDPMRDDPADVLAAQFAALDQQGR